MTFAMKIDCSREHFPAKKLYWGRIETLGNAIQQTIKILVKKVLYSCIVLEY